MSLSTVERPFAQYETGLGKGVLCAVEVGQKGPPICTGDAGVVPREQVRMVLISHSSVCISFWYFTSLTAAWAAYKRQKAGHTLILPRPSLEELLFAEGISPQRLAELRTQARERV